LYKVIPKKQIASKGGSISLMAGLFWIITFSFKEHSHSSKFQHKKVIVVSQLLS